VQNVLFNDINSDENSMTVDGFLNQTGLAALFDLAEVRINPTPITNGVVPEPATMVLLGADMAGLGFIGSRRRRN